MASVKWGIIGPGRIAWNFAKGLSESEHGTLFAIASRSPERGAAFAAEFGVAADKVYSNYQAIFDDPEVDAIHIATPHPFHAEQALMAIRAGKHVSVEKPAGLNAAEVAALTEAAAQEGVFFMEAYMYLHHPQIARAVEILKSGELGAVQHVRALFGFAAGFDPQSRLYDPSMAGGGILDVGGYAVSAARLFAGVAEGRWLDPVSLKGSGVIGQSGIDEVAYGLAKFGNGVTAEIASAVARNMPQVIEVTSEKGMLRLENPWIPGRQQGPADTRIEITGEVARIEEIAAPKMLFAYEAEAASVAILSGQLGCSYPAMTPEASLGNAHVLDTWRRELGYKVVGETPATIRRLSGVLPKGLTPMKTLKVDGVQNPVSQLILGCDNRDTIAEGAVVWDAWLEAGGNTFDTGFVYGGGLHEAILGEWITARGVADQINVIVKGAHTPYCVPDAIGAQLDISLTRLQTNRAAIYIMHRDNPEVPVGEFVEAIARERDKGRIGIWGGSNWTVERFDEAVAYAKAKGLEPPRILNNNLSLAVMEKPVWAGCVTSNTPKTLEWLRRTGTMHMSWSSQARGFFLDAALRGRLPEDTAPDTCYGSAANDERRKRAGELAAKYGVSRHNIAAAWVLGQSFPSFALIGPRSAGEIVSTLPAFEVTLTPEELAWLNLED
ncbi:aldo/keto reductase [Marivivens sp. LCG002]|uniref:aldo/keto reductase n=1 Tax=Marivivens sp. LCG002 TaxID=3051171 RepID=UPI002554BD1D|nr:aldo/keto reductase [Marivivens sp. LCG002]WIV49499.1 aldo/keto reductase [Marivivens sp. LCG002]